MPFTGQRLERLINAVRSDVVILRAPESWVPASAGRILVPVGGRRDQSVLRARLLSNLARAGHRRVTYLRVLSETASERDRRAAEEGLVRLARDETGSAAEVALRRSDDALAELIEISGDFDLVVVGLRRLARRQRTFGELSLRLATEVATPLILISRR